MKETEQQVGPSPQASKATIQHGTHIFLASWSSILETLFDMTMAIFFRVQFWSIGRQFFNQDLRVFLEIGFGDLAAMGSGTIPNQDEFAGYLPPNMFQCCD